MDVEKTKAFYKQRKDDDLCGYALSDIIVVQERMLQGQRA